MKTIYVKCTFTIPVEIKDSYYSEEFIPEFDIEENHCPGTGIVGAALESHIKKCDEAGYCWACNLHGVNEIVDDPSWGLAYV